MASLTKNQNQITPAAKAAETVAYLTGKNCNALDYTDGGSKTLHAHPCQYGSEKVWVCVDGKHVEKATLHNYDEALEFCAAFSQNAREFYSSLNKGAQD